MRRELGLRARFASKGRGDLGEALEAMNADELRAFVREVLERLDDEPRTALEDSLIARAAKGRSGWKPAKPPSRLVTDVKGYAEAARRVGHAEPERVDAFLRQGSRAFLAGDLATARAVFEALLPPIADVEIDLGQHEMVDEVLTVDVHDCAGQYVVSVYATTQLDKRADAVHQAIEAVGGVSAFFEPLREMERVATSPLPDLDDFLPRWLRYLEAQPSSKDDWDRDLDRWLREAVLRLEGVKGLERIARETKKPDALRAWCAALVEGNDWSGALRAFDDSVEMLGSSHSRGYFLDGAALAAQQLGRRDVTDRLKAAWIGDPSLVRLLRWLGAETPDSATIVKRAKMAIAEPPTDSGRQLGLLHLLFGDVPAATALLAKAPGLGWSGDGHPGHVLFPALAGILARGTKAKLAPQLFSGLIETPWDPVHLDDDFKWNDDVEDDAPPALTAPSVMDLIISVGPGRSIDRRGRLAVLKAMQTAATKRAEGILGNRRRQHYGHVASLVACCLELSGAVGERDSITAWLDALRKKYSRFPAFQEELKSALGSIREV
jgi:hypothetical protein